MLDAINKLLLSYYWRRSLQSPHVSSFIEGPEECMFVALLLVMAASLTGVDLCGSRPTAQSRCCLYF